MDAQTTSNLLVALIGVLTLTTTVGLVGAVWAMGRQAYRKD